MVKRNLVGVVLCFLLFLVNVLFAQRNDSTWTVSQGVPRQLDYQGIFTNPDGEPYEGTLTVSFSVINVKDNSVLFTETVQNLEVKNGLIHHLIGSNSNSLDPFIFRNSTALRISINGETLSPDIKIAPAPVALVAMYADSLTGPLPEGPPGSEGPQGQEGPQGKTGPQGEQGIAGSQGQQGEQGPVGPEGQQGPAGSALEPGQNMEIKDVTGINTHVLDANGNSWHKGSGEFTNGLKVSAESKALFAYSSIGPAIHAIFGDTTNNNYLFRKDFDDNNTAFGTIRSDGPFDYRTAKNNPDVGVLGEGDKANPFSKGVYGYSAGDRGMGVGGECNSSHGIGVYGRSSDGRGVFAYSTDGIGLYAKSEHGVAGHFEGKVVINGDVHLDGEVYAKSLHTKDNNGDFTSGITTEGDANAKSVSIPREGGGQNKIDAKGIRIYRVDDTSGILGDWESNGDFFTTGEIVGTDGLRVYGTKSSVVQTNANIHRSLYAVEAAEVYFVDHGRSQLVNGQVNVQLDPIFLETVTINENYPMIVQITPTADCKGVFVLNQSSNGFTVKELMQGTSNATFNWEVTAKRKGYESVRMEPYESKFRLERR
jgi:hypothetical protein